MIKIRKQSTTTYPINFLMVDATDHITAKTGLTPTVTLSKNGGAFAAAAGAVSEIGSGWYSLAGNATDNNTLGDLLVHAFAAGADPCDILCAVVSYDPFADIASILEDTATTIPGTITTIDNEVAVIDGVVDTILADMADVNDVLTPLAVVDGNVDTIVADYARRTGDYSTHTAADVWAVTVRTLSSFGTLIADIWAYATRTLTTISGLGADVWQYASRTLTQSAASVAAAVSGDSITVIRGDTASISLTDLGSLANNSKIYFTVKNQESDPDSAAIIQIEKTAGLVTIKGAAAGTAANASLTIDDQATGDITILIKAPETMRLDVGTFDYDVEIVRSTGVLVSTLTQGSFIVTSDITKAIT